MQPTEEPRAFQRILDIFEGALAPSVFLLAPVDGHEHLLHQRIDPGPEVRLGLEHLDRRHPSLEEGLLDVGAPPAGLGLGDPAQAVRADTKPPLDDDGPDPVRELELDRRHDG